MTDVQSDTDCELDEFDEYEGPLPSLEEIVMSALDDPVYIRVEGDDDA